MKHFIKLIGAALIASLCASASASFVINEIDSDTPGTDALEFIELKGNANEQATSVILVLYDGQAAGPKSIFVRDLSDLQADSNGYILIADPNIPNATLYMTPGTLQNGEDAVALYTGTADQYTTGSGPITSGLIDLLIFEANNQTNRNWSGFGPPTPPIYNEGLVGGVTELGLSRIPDGPGGSWVPAFPSPKAVNVNPSIDIAAPDFFLRYNQATVAVASTRTVTLRNSGSAPLTVNSLQLSPSSSPQLTQVAPPNPPLPVTLSYNQATSIVVQLLDPSPTTNKTYTGAINYTTDSSTSPSGTVNFSIELVRATQQVAAGAVKVNEICYNPGTEDHNHDGSTANQNDEYVEIVNMTASPIVIEGWEQRCSDFDTENFHSYVFPVGATLPANGFVTVFTSGNPTGFIPGTTFTYTVPRIRNTGSRVGISDATKLVDGVAFLGAEDTPDADGYVNSGVSAVAGGSIGRRPDGGSTFRAFAPADVIVTDRTSPNLTNGFNAGIRDWSLF